MFLGKRVLQQIFLSFWGDLGGRVWIILFLYAARADLAPFCHPDALSSNRKGKGIFAFFIWSHGGTVLHSWAAHLGRIQHFIFLPLESLEEQPSSLCAVDIGSQGGPNGIGQVRLEAWHKTQGDQMLAVGVTKAHSRIGRKYHSVFSAFVWHVNRLSPETTDNGQPPDCQSWAGCKSLLPSSIQVSAFPRMKVRGLTT